MPAVLHCSLPVSGEAVESLWQSVIAHRKFSDDSVGIACVNSEEMKALNNQYRGKDKPTNVLTFSYGESEHDVVVCLEVAQNEARVREVELDQYVALLLVHAFIHVTGLDHEHSAEDAHTSEELETVIMQEVGYTPIAL